MSKGFVGKLSVTIHGASALPDKQLLGKQDPYARLECGNEHFKTLCIDGAGTNVTWEQAFIFNLKGSEDLFHIQVLDKEVLSDRSIGRADLRIRDICLAQGKQQYELNDKDNFSKKAGYIHITFNYEGKYPDGVTPPSKSSSSSSSSSTTTFQTGAAIVTVQHNQPQQQQQQQQQQPQQQQQYVPQQQQQQPVYTPPSNVQYPPQQQQQQYPPQAQYAPPQQYQQYPPQQQYQQYPPQQQYQPPPQQYQPPPQQYQQQPPQQYYPPPQQYQPPPQQYQPPPQQYQPPPQNNSNPYAQFIHPSSSPTPDWACGACTFWNKGGVSRCAMCQRPR